MAEENVSLKPKDTNVRAERFKRLAEKRTKRILRLLNLLANCANKTNYYYSEEQVNKIFTTIDDKLKIVRERFSSAAKDKEDVDFEL